MTSTPGIGQGKENHRKGNSDYYDNKEFLDRSNRIFIQDIRSSKSNEPNYSQGKI